MNTIHKISIDMNRRQECETSCVDEQMISILNNIQNDIQDLSNNFTILRNSFDNATIPTIDDNLLSLIVATLAAFTICIVVCQLVILYTSHLESKKEERRRIMVQQKKNNSNI